MQEKKLHWKARNVEGDFFPISFRNEVIWLSSLLGFISSATVWSCCCIRYRSWLITIHCILTAPSFIGPFPPVACLSFWACSRCRLSSLLFFKSSALLDLSWLQSGASFSPWPHSSPRALLVFDCVPGALLVGSSNDPQSPTSHASPSASVSWGGLSVLHFALLRWDDFKALWTVLLLICKEQK